MRFSHVQRAGEGLALTTDTSPSADLCKCTLPVAEHCPHTHQAWHWCHSDSRVTVMSHHQLPRLWAVLPVPQLHPPPAMAMFSLLLGLRWSRAGLGSASPARAPSYPTWGHAGQAGGGSGDEPSPAHGAESCSRGPRMLKFSGRSSTSCSPVVATVTSPSLGPEQQTWVFFQGRA